MPLYEAERKESQQRLPLDAHEESTPAPIAPQPWPASIVARVKLVTSCLTIATAPLAARDIAGLFTRAREADVAEVLDSLSMMGRARQVPSGKWVGA